MLVTCNTLGAPAWGPPVSFRLGQELALFRVQVSAHAHLLPVLRPLLTAEEALRADRYHRPADRTRFALARAVLRVMLSKYSGMPPAAIRLGSGPNKKPWLLGASHVQFNLSHAQDWLLLAVAGFAVGVDVEEINPQFDFQAVLAYSFSPAEQAFIEAGTASRALFFQSWTRKEALAKATGQGIDADFQQLPALDGRHYLAGPGLGASQPGAWVVSSFALAPGYAAAVAYAAPAAAPALGFYTVGSELLTNW